MCVLAWVILPQLSPERCQHGTAEEMTPRLYSNSPVTTSIINVRPKHATARILRVVNDDVVEIIVADINAAGVAALLAEDGHGETHHPGLSAIHEVPPSDRRLAGPGLSDRG